MTFRRTEVFDAWLMGLKDSKGRARIVQHVVSAQLGNFGDCKPVGEEISEMRVHFGPGYRVYFTRIEGVVYWLLASGDKASQKTDIKRAVELARELRKE